MSFTQIASYLICCSFFALKALRDHSVVHYCNSWGFMSCPDSWGAASHLAYSAGTSAKLSPLLLHARDLHVHWRRAAPSLPSHSLSEAASEWLSELKKAALTRPVNKTEGRDHIWSPGAHLTGCLARFERKLTCFLKGKDTRAPFLFLFTATAGDLRHIYKAFVTWSWVSVCYGTDFHLFWGSRMPARGVSWIHFDEVALIISPYSKCCWISWSLKYCPRVYYLFFSDRNQI